jgi:hypothetical protein
MSVCDFVKAKEIYKRAYHALRDLPSLTPQQLKEFFLPFNKELKPLKIVFYQASLLDQYYFGVKGGYWWGAYKYPLSGEKITSKDDTFTIGTHGLLTMNIQE